MTDERPKTSRRDRGQLQQRLATWLASKLDRPTMGEVSIPATTGMSSETLLFDLTYHLADRVVTDRCVARLPPDSADDPVFPHYDMEMQFRAMELVGQRTAAPVPPTLWLETDPAHLGAPFFVMRRIDGIVPPDVMPYTFGDNWFFAATPEQRRQVQDSSVRTLAEIHRIAADDPALTFVPRPAAGRSALRAHVDGWQAYHDWVVSDGVRSPISEAAFEHLEQTWPAETEARLSWGDARVGNILYQDFAPSAVLDWEMAGVAPREVDLGWMVYLHRFFQDLAEVYGMPGIADFMRPADVVAVYAEHSGYTPADLRWFIEYAAARHAVIMFRIARRSAGFGEAEFPEDPDLAVPHAATIRQMIDGSYWSRLDPTWT